jgi:hypothetical protein
VCGAGRRRNDTACEDCAAGQYKASASTAEECTACECGLMSQAGSALCTSSCSGGFYSRDGHTCELCPVGSSCHEGMMVLCSSGTYQALEGQAGCLDCPPSSFAARPGQEKCGDCPSGEQALSVITGPDSCPY